MRKLVLTKDGKLPQLHAVRARLYADDIMQLFLERLNNHTLSEVCKYIAGYFYRQQIANFNKIKQAADRIEKLEAALREIAEDCEIESGPVQGAQVCATIARKALGEEP